MIEMPTAQGGGFASDLQISNFNISQSSGVARVEAIMQQDGKPDKFTFDLKSDRLYVINVTGDGQSLAGLTATIELREEEGVSNRATVVTFNPSWQ